MKKVAVFLAVAGMVAGLASTASASYVLNGETVKITSGDYRTGNGGPFRLTVQEDTSRTFETFCLEYGEHITLGNVYSVTVDDAAIGGGAGAVNGRDPLSVGTAKLYIDWRSDKLDEIFTGVNGFSYSSAEANQQVQMVIWTFENEYTGSLTDLGNLIRDYYDDDLSEYTGDAVKVANLYTTDATGTVHAQSQLTLMSVPEPAAVAVWSVLGLIGAALVRRRRNRK